MSQRDIDVSYVLEHVAGVHGVYSVPGRHGPRYAVHLDTGGRVLARVHYALLRILSREECADVVLYQGELPCAVLASARRLELTSSTREEARARVPATATEPSQATPLRMANESRHSVLIVDDDADVEHAAAMAFRHVTSISNPAAALVEAKAHRFDMILCGVERAFGPGGFVTNLADHEPTRARRVVLILTSDRDPDIRTRWFDWKSVYRPVTLPDLRGAMWRLSSLRDPSLLAVAVASQRRDVLLIDESCPVIEDTKVAMSAARTSTEALARSTRTGRSSSAACR